MSRVMGYLGGAGRGDLRYSEQAEQVGNLEMDHGNKRQEYLIDFFDKYCLFRISYTIAIKLEST